MIITIAAALLFAAPQAAPQTPPPAEDITANLNSGPPRPAEYIAPEPTPEPEPQPTVEPEPEPEPVPPAGSVSSARTPVADPPKIIPTPPPPRVRPAPVDAAPRATPGAAPRAATAAPAAPPVSPPTAQPAASAEAADPPPPPSVPAVTVLDAAARAALPFTVDLPAGFELVTGRPGPDFRIYTIRRDGRSFAMVYAGPASQFPIYSGEVLEAGGRATVVSTENGVRHAREHLFIQPEGTAPREIHVWTMSLEGADRALAERIAQTVDVR